MSTPSFKIVLLGEGRVGKTSILLRYVDNTYTDRRESTLQASYLEKKISIPSTSDELHNTNVDISNTNTANLYIWDTAGQERFHALGPIYYRDADGAILVYDITDLQSFDRVQMWTKELRKMVGTEDVISLIIVGNKVDLAKTKRSVKMEDAKNYADSVGAMYMETSAKSGLGVDEVFLKLTRRMMERRSIHRSNSRGLASAVGAIGGGKKLILTDKEEQKRKSKHSTSEGYCC
uniref:Ras-related protein Rab-21 n=1 Tax=Helicotheca tamesis TaxID=374047 RepID=A0A7S2H2U8_9STRA|mmetsp:Transcript_14788/g.20171  ORF Transcript_14788/g.20171 Transcript_14788/m.20171 type:complete len:234 (+) Transcript_14788:167-868(+)|eukprot:CAMPEP_0185723678 /NCGR_PEP_ID=MMETSP1171-20130828/436_1 /TAXON_ID=374046 /ORGANISM="Helicotheca tamensis, Strain CCMP826" /LENGTH=233 /DNA_ID=CAMNT_0028391417 /DNA_START=132 /DNA_END=833 /DNA_ORIENTATION=+